MAGNSRTGTLNPTLFDKLLAGHELAGLQGGELEKLEEKRDSVRSLSIGQGQRFTEAALKATVRRELAWLLNTTNFDSVFDLTDFPQVASSVLNYGVADLAGKALNETLLRQRAKQIRTAVLAFEPRISPDSLEIEVSDTVERENAVTFVISADVSSAVRAIPVKFRTDIEADSSAVTVRD